MKTQPGKFTLSGDGLCIGRDSGDNVSQDCKATGECKGGTILALGSVSASSCISISRGWPQHCSPPSKTGDRAVGDGSFPMRASAGSTLDLRNAAVESDRREED